MKSTIGLMERVRRALRSVTTSGTEGWSGGAASGWDAILPSTSTDWAQQAGPLWLNGVVNACIRWIIDNVSEPQLLVEQLRDGDWSPLPEHPLIDLIQNPNPNYDGATLWQATAMSYALDGNAFWIIGRSSAGAGGARELWWYPHWLISPVIDTTTGMVTGYKRSTKNGSVTELPQDVIHFRCGIDPSSPGRGYPRLRAVLRSLCMDNEAQTYGVALLKNFALPGLVISPRDPTGRLSADVLTRIKQTLSTMFTGDNRGKPLGMTIPVQVDRLSLTPEELALDKLQTTPEARICAAFGLSPMLLNLGAGDRQRTYANYGAARRAGYEDCLLPMHRRFAASLAPLLLEFGGRDRRRCTWSYDQVSAMQPDRTADAARSTSLLTAGVVTVNEARAINGYAPLAAGGDEVRPLNAPAATAPAAARSLADQARRLRELRGAA